MKGRPEWFKGVVEGGKPKDAPEAQPESTPTPVAFVPEVSPPAREATSGDSIRPEGLVFSLNKDGWKHQGGASGAEGSSETSKESDLVRLYLDLSGNPPANFSATVRVDRVQDAAKKVRSWTVDALHTYLSGSEVWKWPSYTKAIFEEIRSRMLLGKMSPRE